MSPTRGSANLKRSTLSTHHNDPEAPPLKKPTPQPSPSSRPPNSTSTAPAANEPKPGPQSNSNSLASHRKSDTVPPEGTTTAQKNVPPVAVPNDKNPKIARRSYPPSSGRRPSSVTPVSPTLPKVPTTETTEKLNQSLQKLTSSGSEKGPGVANGDTTSKTPSTQAATENQMAESITVLNSSKDCPPTKPPCRVITLRNPILRETLKTYKEPEVPGTRETTKDSTPPSPEQETLDTQRQRPSPPDLSPLYQQVKQASPTAALAKEDLAKTESVRRQVIGGPTIAMPQFMPGSYPSR